MKSNFKRPATLSRGRAAALLALLLPAAACETVVDVDVAPTTPRLVVDGGIERRWGPDSAVQRITLATTSRFVGPAAVPPPVTTATVSVSDGATEYPFAHEGNGVYAHRNLPAEVGRTYTLRIAYNNETYEAQETLLAGPAIERLYYEFEPANGFQPAGNYVKINTRDPADARNYYQWKLYINGELQMNPDPGNSFEVIASDEFFNGQALTGLRPNGEVTVQPGDAVRVQQLAISRRLYDYLFGIFNLTASTPLFGDPPPANIAGNVRNLSNARADALGYFRACEVSEQALTVQ